jgi:hypothetical protein
VKIYNFAFNEQDIAILDQLLKEAPYRVAAPIVNKMNAQIAEQEKPPQADSTKQTATG